MKRIIPAVVAALGLALASGSALAQHMGGGGGHMGGGMSGGSYHGGGGGSYHGGGGSYHGGGYYGGGHYHGGYYHGGYYYPYFSFALGFPYYGYGYPYYAGYPYYGYPYYSSAYYPGPYYPGYSGYSDAPAYDDSGTYVQRDMSSAPQSNSAPLAAPGTQEQYSYYCPNPAGYYPQIQTCANGWLKVVPDHSPQAPH